MYGQETRYIIILIKMTRRTHYSRESRRRILEERSWASKEIMWNAEESPRGVQIYSLKQLRTVNKN